MLYKNLEESAKTDKDAAATIVAKNSAKNFMRMMRLRCGHIVIVYDNYYATCHDPANMAIIAEGLWLY